MILRQIERIERSEILDELVVATSTDPTDDELAEALDTAGIVVRRGPLDDVLGRFLLVADEFDPSTIVRLTGDNPLADPQVIDRVLTGHLTAGTDYTSNSLQRTFPYGLDVECVRPAALRELADLGPTAEEREHVTLGIYRRPERWTVHQVVQERDVSHLRWSVDYPADFDFAETVYEELYREIPEFGQAEVLALLDRRPDLVRTTADVP
jgi:spore coat polysaccharide biosynthesis protein SpsF